MRKKVDLHDLLKNHNLIRFYRLNGDFIQEWGDRVTSGNDIFNNIYFKMHCLYNAKTEMYDRTLTDRRDRYDQTEAYITEKVRHLSNSNAMRVYQFCVYEIERATKKPFDSKLWKDSIREYNCLSAQGWIDLYKYLVINKIIPKRISGQIYMEGLD